MTWLVCTVTSRVASRGRNNLNRFLEEAGAIMCHACMGIRTVILALGSGCFWIHWALEVCAVSALITPGSEGISSRQPWGYYVRTVTSLPLVPVCFFSFPSWSFLSHLWTPGACMHIRVLSALWSRGIPDQLMQPSGRRCPCVFWASVSADVPAVLFS